MEIMRSASEVVLRDGGRTLEQALEQHAHWLHGDDGFFNSHRLRLSGEDLSYVDLGRYDLSECYIEKCNLREASLYNTTLIDAYIGYCDLTGCNLSGCNLVGGTMKKCDLNRCCINSCNFYRCRLIGCVHVPYIPPVCPPVGSFTAFKKALVSPGQSCIVELLIPEDAKRSSGTSRKCRCSKAQVVRLFDLNKDAIPYNVAYSSYCHGFIYEEGEIVEASNFDPDRWNECAPGIHFYMSWEEAAMQY